jgi:hypothetical protein
MTFPNSIDLDLVQNCRISGSVDGRNFSLESPGGRLAVRKKVWCPLYASRVGALTRAIIVVALAEITQTLEVVRQDVPISR